MRQNNKILSNEFEKKRWPYYIILPLSLILVLWIIIKNKVNALFRKQKWVGFLLFDGIGRYGKVIKKNVTGWKAVDLIYNHRFGEDRTIGGRLDDFWFESLNCQAARNRFKLAKKELKKAILDFSNKQKEVRVISLAAGTGQIESETVGGINNEKNGIKVILVDKELEALRRAQDFISINNVSEQIEVKNADIKHAIDMARSFRPHIVTVIAFLDYMSEEEAIKLISGIYEILPEGGYFIASNTMPNVEMNFVKWVVGWPLIYRRHKDIANIIAKSGFINHDIIDEPLHIQTVAVARKIK